MRAIELGNFRVSLEKEDVLDRYALVFYDEHGTAQHVFGINTFQRRELERRLLGAVLPYDVR